MCERRRTYSLAQAAAAHRYVETGQKTGSIALVKQTCSINV